MKYSHQYRKLSKPKYTTIRRYAKHKINDIVCEYYPNGSHKSVIVNIIKKSLDDLTEKFLIDDTDCISRAVAYDLFESFYRKPIDFKNEKFTIYFMKRI